MRPLASYHVSADRKEPDPPTYESEGLQRQTCSVCGTVLAEESVPMLIASTSCTLSEKNLRIKLGETSRLTAVVLPEDATGAVLSWLSSDDAVATVDQSGLVAAVGKGRAAIYCKTADGFASDACEVEVYYTFGQWVDHRP